jgi:hypothetical protein
MPMIAITTSSSTNVKPELGRSALLGASGFASAVLCLTDGCMSGPILLRLALHLDELEILAFLMDHKG